MEIQVSYRKNNRWRLLGIIWGLVFLVAIAALAIAVPGYLSGFPFDPGREIQASWWMLAFLRNFSSLTSFSSAAISIALAVLLFRKQHEERMAIYLSFYLMAFAVIMAGPLEAILFIVGASWDIALFAQMAMMLPTILFLFTFPNGRFEPGWTKWLAVPAVLSIVIILLRPASDWTLFSSAISQAVLVVIVLLILIGLNVQIYRFRNLSTQLERQQVKWVVAGLIAWMFYMALSAFPWIYVQGIPVDQPLPWWSALAGTIWWLSLIILPISLTVAILRFRLWDIDIIIRRTLQYALLTGLLVLVYFGSIMLLQKFIEALTGQQSPIVIVISTLGIAALFNPLRLRVQRFIDRRFFRRKYDAEQTLTRFAAIARDEVDMDKLTVALLDVVEESMQPERVSLWLKPVRKIFGTRNLSD
jgi:hypothetical protein